ncbi:MAG: O-antigen ligase family protein [Vibrio sp.]
MNKYSKLLRSSKPQLCVFIVVLAYTFTVIPFEDVSRVFRTLLAIASVFYFALEGKPLFKDPIFKFLLLALIIPALSWVNGRSIIPEFISSGPHLERLARIFIFILLAYWLKGKTSRIYWLWGCFILGFTAACLLFPDSIQQIIDGINGRRVNFGIKNAQFTSMFAGLSLLGCLLSIPLALKTKVKPSIKLFSCSVAFIFAVFSLLILVISQSRQAWLAFAVAIFVMPIVAAFLYKKIRIVFFSYIVIGIIGFTISQARIFENRANQEHGTISAIMEGKTIPMTSIGIRVNSWIAATDWIKAHPIIGSSSSAIPQVIQQSERFSPQLKQQFGHLHNFYMETLVAYGVVGISLIIGLYYWVLRSLFVYKSQCEDYNKQQLPIIIIGAFGLITYWTIINCFETFNSRSFGVFAQTIIFSSIYTFYLSYRLDVNKKYTD